MVTFVAIPVTTLHCGNELCQRTMVFTPDIHGVSTGKLTVFEGELWTPGIAKFTCRHCSTFVYLMPFVARLSSMDLTIKKIGEDPMHMPPTPQRLLTLLGDNKEAFLKGRRAEALGMGVGAAAYYRRVVERIKDNLLSYLASSLERTELAPQLAIELRGAVGSPRFKDAVSAIQHALPDALLIRGQNPLALLLGALSAQLHQMSDEKCLEYANAIRTVLTKLVEAAEQLRSDSSEVDAAIRTLHSMRPGEGAPSE